MATIELSPDDLKLLIEQLEARRHLLSAQNRFVEDAAVASLISKISNTK